MLGVHDSESTMSAVLLLLIIWVGLQCVIVLFPDHIHLLLEAMTMKKMFLLHYLERMASVQQMYTDLIVMSRK